jgi:hypothetical protein
MGRRTSGAPLQVSASANSPWGPVRLTCQRSHAFPPMAQSADQEAPAAAAPSRQNRCSASARRNRDPIRRAHQRSRSARRRGIGQVPPPDSRVDALESGDLSCSDDPASNSTFDCRISTPAETTCRGRSVCRWRCMGQAECWSTAPYSSRDVTRAAPARSALFRLGPVR